MEIAEAFEAVLAAEQKVTEAKAEAEQAAYELSEAKAEEAAAWEKVKACLAETGEWEVTIPGKVVDYKVGYLTKPRTSVKVDDPDAVPDEFVKMERKPKLKEIGEYLGTLDTLPNWARLEPGEKKLSWKSVKK